MAKCYIHETEEAKARCKVCKKVMCQSCMPDYEDEERVCPVCRKPELEKDVNNYFWILLFICVAFVCAAAFVLYFIFNMLKGFKGMNSVGIIVVMAIVVVGVGFFIYLFIVDYKIYKSTKKKLEIANKYLIKLSETNLDEDFDENSPNEHGDANNLETDLNTEDKEVALEQEQKSETKDLENNSKTEPKASKATTSKTNNKKQ